MTILSVICRLLLAAGCCLAGARDGRCGPLGKPEDFEAWVRERVGPVVYPSTPDEGPTWEGLAALSTELGSRAIKTWVGAQSSGETMQKLKSPPYRRMIAEFPIIHLNLSQSFIKNGMQGSRLDPQTFRDAVREWHDATLYLCRESRIPGQVFLLSVGAELNVYVGTEFSKAPKFPVAEYVNACHEAVAEALATVRGPRPSVFTVAEIQSDIEFEDYAARWVPRFQTDLISLSHYAFYRDIHEPLAVIRRHLKALGPFGRERLMLGEFGPVMEGCWVTSGNRNQTTQLKHHDTILRKAYAEGLQFAFFYELADQPAVIKVSGHDGLAGWNSDGSPYYRLAWTYYHRIYRGGKAFVPDFDLYERHAQAPPRNEPGLPNLVLADLAAADPDCRAGERLAFRLTVKNTGGGDAKATTVIWFVDDVTVAWSNVPALKAGGEIEIDSTREDGNFVWQASAGQHRASAVIDDRGALEETTTEDNTLQRWIRIQP